MFQSNLASVGHEYHSFVTDSIVLNAIGMSSYTYKSIKNLLTPSGEGNSPPKEIEEFLGDLQTLFDDLTGADLSKCEILAFDPQTQTYQLKSGTDVLSTYDGASVGDIPTLLEAHNTNQWGVGGVDENIQKVVRQIQGSYSGCICIRATVTGETYTDSVGEDIIVKLYLRDKEDSDTSRCFAQNNAPFICAVPKRPTGQKYSWQGTQDKPVGVYQKPHEGDNSNPKNAVAAELKMTYNPSIGKWESGTQQMLARLITDVDAAAISEINLENIDSIRSDEFYNVNSNYYMGQFAIGKAISLSVENGNPHMFGPNIVTSGNTNKVEKIMVVNRSPRSFKKNDVVMCSHIDGEWIIQGFDSKDISVTPPGLKISKWSFGKFLANSDSFFRDDRFPTDSTKRDRYLHRAYEEAIRKKYYYHMLQGGGDSAAPTITDANLASLKDMNDMDKIARINIYGYTNPEGVPRYYMDGNTEEMALNQSRSQMIPPDFAPNQKYVQTTAFDQVGKHMGGTNDYNIIGRTNVSYSPDGTTDPNAWYQTNLPNFWGPVFTEGFTSQAHANLSTARPMIPMNGSLRLGMQRGNIFFVTANDGSQVLSASTSLNRTADSGNFMFSAQSETSLVQLPAEIGVNGSPDNPNSSPIESLDSLVSAEQNNGNLLDVYNSYFKSRFRYTWLASAIDSGNIYGFAPATAAKVQFSPLQLEYAVHAYSPIEEITPNTPAQNVGYSGLKASFAQTLSPGTGSSNCWGNLISSVSRGASKTRGIADFPLIGPDTETDGDGPIGGPELLPRSDVDSSNEKSNFVGIVIAKNKFSAGSNIGFTTEQYFGIPPKKTVTGGTTGGFTFIPLGGGGVAWNGPSTEGKSYGFPQWGSADDSVQSFGTVALHVRIFDQWPDEQTIFDPRYYGILHFNPLDPSGDGTIQTKRIDDGVTVDPNWSPGKPLPKYPRNVDQIGTSVDFRIPTYADPRGGSNDNKPIPIGTSITSGVIIRPASEWRINPIRRGRLLTGGTVIPGGFRYYRRVIGVNPAIKQIRNGGEGFSVNEEINLTKGVKIKVTSIGSNGSISDVELRDKGEGFLPSDFPASGFPFTFAPKNGKPATIAYLQGIVYDKLAYDPCPLESTNGPFRLTLPSFRGEKVTEGKTSASIGLTGSGKYDAFYFFHNDILATPMDIRTFVPGFHQYVKLDIGGG